MTTTQRTSVQFSLPILGGLRPSELIRLTRLAEEAGLDGVVCGEVAGVDAVAVLAAAASATRRLRLETNVLSVLSRSPSLLAMTASTMAELTGGRFVLGLGAGTPMVAGFHGTTFDGPLGRVARWLTAVREALDGGRLDAFGSFKLSGIEPEPVPLVLAAVNPRMLALAGQLADGVSLNLCGPEQAREFGDLARRAAAAADRPPPGVYTTLWLAAGDPRQGRELFALEMAPYLAVPTYRRAVVGLSDDDAVDRAVAALRTGGRKAAAEVFPEPILDALVATGVEDARVKIDSLAVAGCSGVRVHPLIGRGRGEDAAAALAQLAEAVDATGT